MSFRIAERQATLSEHNQHRLGAVIVKGGNILATGYNQLRPTKTLRHSTLHAEEAAILKLLDRNRLHQLAGSSIYVFRTTRGNAVGLARPCERCMDLIRSVGIRTIHYTVDEHTTVTEKV